MRRPIPAIPPAARCLRQRRVDQSENLVERSAIMGRRLLAGLEGLRDLPNVGDVRGLGMMAASSWWRRRRRAHPRSARSRVAKERWSRA